MLHNSHRGIIFSKFFAYVYKVQDSTHDYCLNLFNFLLPLCNHYYKFSDINNSL